MKYSRTLLMGALTCVVAGAPFANATDHSRPQSSAKASKSEVVGVGAGVAIGAAVGGPVGAILGAAIGGHYGDTRHEAKTHKRLASLTQSELETSRLKLGESMSAQARLDDELLDAQDELDTLTQKIEQLFVERAVVDGLQFDVHFDTDDVALADADRAQLARLSQLLQALPEAEVALYGFADTRGETEHNETLSLDRAYSVADTLNGLGVAQRQIKTYALGESKSSYTGDDVDTYAHDRRVSIRLQLPTSVEPDHDLENARVESESRDFSRGQ